jgi:hypothetical protein
MHRFEPLQRRFATCLSGPPLARHAVRSLFVGLARLSLWTACLLMLSSCLVDDPPPYSAPNQTPPRINTRDVRPLLNQFIVTKSTDTLDFIIPFTSEDAGEDLNAVLLIDYDGVKAPIIGAFTSIQPSTQADVRNLSLSYQVVASPGCHLITLRLGHTSSLRTAGAHPQTNAADIAEAYWWMFVDVDPSQGTALNACLLAPGSGP